MKIKFVYFALLLLFTVQGANAQFYPQNIRLDVAFGGHFGQSKFSQGYKITARPFSHFIAGLNYNMSSKLFYRLELASDFNRTAKGSEKIKNDCYRMTLGAGKNLLSYFGAANRFDNKTIKKILKSTKLNAFVGLGGSVMVNKLNFGSDEWSRIIPYDYVLNICAAISPSYSITNDIAVYGRFNYIAHLKQGSNFDMTSYKEGPFMDAAGFMNYSVGVMVRPFRTELKCVNCN